MIDLFGRKLRRKEAELKERELELAEKQADIDDRKLKQQQVIARMMQEEQVNRARKDAPIAIAPPVLPASVVPKDGVSAVAMDSCSPIYEYASQGIPSFYGSFLGYPALAAMSQSSDYRSVSETTATEMTREWGQFKIVDPDSDEGEGLTDTEREAFKQKKDEINSARQEKINQINEAFDSYGIRGLVRRAIEVEMSMGRAQIYIDLGDQARDSLPLLINDKGVRQDSLKGFRLIEPMWSTPSVYNAADPTAEDFYKPTKWFVLGREVHADRLMTLIMRPVPDILKPAYNFGGISMFQLMKPYVERYQRTADSTSWIVQAFSLTILKTDMSGILSGGEGSGDMWMRVGVLNNFRENSGTVLLDKESEEIEQINTPLTGLHELLTKSQEQMAGPSHTPLVKLLGITPDGIGNSTDGEIRVYYDYIMAQNEAHARPLITKIADLIQLDLFGEIDPTIQWEFNPLYQMTDKEQAEVQEIKMRTSKDGVDAGIVSQQEARNALSKDENSPFNGIDVDDVPDGEMSDNDDFDDENNRG